MDPNTSARNPSYSLVHQCSNHCNFRLRCLVGHSMGLGYMGPRLHAVIHHVHRFSGVVCSSCHSLDLSPQFANKHVVMHSDNQPTVAVVNSKTSKSSSMLVLLRFLTPHCMLNNITIMSIFLPGSANQVPDALSHLQFSRFHQLMPLADPVPTALPTFLSPLSEHTFKNLQL